MPTEKIEGRTFNNERVALDNRAFISCKFNGVTFVYADRGTLHSLSCQFSGQVTLETNHPAVNVYERVSRDLTRMASGRQRNK
jgi:hypothetical protein